MADFTPITTQEEFNKAISARLNEQASRIRAEYAGHEEMKKELESLRAGKEMYDSTVADLNEKLGVANKEIEGLKEANAKQEANSVKTRIAVANGIPLDFIDRIKGMTEEEIKEDVANLKGFFAPTIPPTNPAPPVATPDPKKEALKDVLKNLRNED